MYIYSIFFLKYFKCLYTTSKSSGEQTLTEIKPYFCKSKAQTNELENKENKAIAMMRRKSPRSENIYLIENHCQANISK